MQDNSLLRARKDPETWRAGACDTWRACGSPHARRVSTRQAIFALASYTRSVGVLGFLFTKDERKDNFRGVRPKWRDKWSITLSTKPTEEPGAREKSSIRDSEEFEKTDVYCKLLYNEL